MIDAREPKNGDYARYVEELVNAGAAPPAPPQAPPQAPPRAPQPASARPARGSTPDARTGGPLPRQPRTQEAERQSPPEPGEFAHVLRRVAGITSFIGLALILLSLTDMAPFFADPAFGMLLLAAGIFLNRFARKLR